MEVRCVKTCRLWLKGTSELQEHLETFFRNSSDPPTR